MTPAARISAAIEILDEVMRGKGAADTLIKVWGKAHRFAGSGDRRGIAETVYSALRAGAASRWRMQAESGRALALGLLAVSHPADEIAGLFSGEGHAPSVLTVDELARLQADQPNIPNWVRAGVPEWIGERLQARYGEDWIAEAQAAALHRAPVDLRVNGLRGPVDKALNLLAHDDVRPEPIPFSAWGLRLPPAFARDIQTTRAFQTGWIEVQDEGSQIAAWLAGARPGETVVDYCAGGGGKTLALAMVCSSPPSRGRGREWGAAPPPADGGAVTPIPDPSPIKGEGRLIACDVNTKRLAVIAPRLQAAGAAAEIRRLGPHGEGMEDLENRADLVFVDAPCSGSGTFRRHPEMAWRLTPETLPRLAEQQQTILTQAAKLVRPGGRLAYVTCSMFAEENEAVATAFAAVHRHFRPRPIAEAVRTPNLTPEGAARLAALADRGHTLQLTPLRTNTDGFFVAFFERTA